MLEESLNMNKKRELILKSAMEILLQDGDQGLSMRKLSQRAEMSLSNLQYYFKTKEVLLDGLLSNFLEGYIEALDVQKINSQSYTKNDLEKLFQFLLEEQVKSNCGIIFKEVWSIASRNKQVEKSLNLYYKDLKGLYFELLTPFSSSSTTSKQLDSVVNIILSFYEGFCITKKQLCDTQKEIGIQLAGMVYPLIQKKS